jgi:hypothetical protein
MQGVVTQHGPARGRWKCDRWPHFGHTGTLRTGKPGRDSLEREENAQVRRGALGGTRTPNLLIRSQMLYPLSYERGS